jgi:hypothetical protein
MTQTQAQTQTYIPLSNRDFAALGMQHIAYVKPVKHEGRDAFAIHSADGTQIAIAASRDVAIALIRRNSLEAVSAH